MTCASQDQYSSNRRHNSARLQWQTRDTKDYHHPTLECVRPRRCLFLFRQVVAYCAAHRNTSLIWFLLTMPLLCSHSLVVKRKQQPLIFLFFCSVSWDIYVVFLRCRAVLSFQSFDDNKARYVDRYAGRKSPLFSYGFRRRLERPCSPLMHVLCPHAPRAEYYDKVN